VDSFFLLKCQKIDFAENDGQRLLNNSNEGNKERERERERERDQTYLNDFFLSKGNEHRL